MEPVNLTEQVMVNLSSPPRSHQSNKHDIEVASKAVDGTQQLSVTEESLKPHVGKQADTSQTDETGLLKSESKEVEDTISEETIGEEKEADPVFDGTENPETDSTRGSSAHPLEHDVEGQGSVWPEKAAAIKNYVKERGAIAVSSVLRRLSGKRDESEAQDRIEGTAAVDNTVDPSLGSKPKENSQRSGEKSTWNPLNYIKLTREVDQLKVEQGEDANLNNQVQEPVVKGRVVLYARLGCNDCRLVRSFLHQKGLKPVEINIDIFPGRKIELEKNSGSSAVPKVFFNDVLVGGLGEIRAMDDSGELEERIKDLVNTEPSQTAPLPPFSGEDDSSGNGTIDELSFVVRKMKERILIKDRFYKMRRFSNCFLGSEAVDFLSDDQYLEREEAVEFGQKLAEKFFIFHVLDENVFEDGNQLYRFLDHDPVVISQCYNIPRGIIDVKPRSATEIASRLRFISCAIFEAYVSDDGQHVDYTRIRDCEEFARYLRIVEELQRVELFKTSREEKLAFFINLYNMMAVHAIVSWGYPTGPLERRRFLGEFKYVVGGYPYSLSAIQNGILRSNQRPPYNLMKPFGLKDKRAQVALPYLEPLVHFALVCGTRSGPSLRCYSPSNIDKELVEAARYFMRNGGLTFDAQAKVVYVSKILRWYSVDFGKNETEVIKHAANYLVPSKSEELLELLACSQLKVVYQPYDWGLNC